MSLVPAGRHILTPYRRFFQQAAPLVAYGLARDAYQLGRTYLHARAARPVTTHNTVSNPSSNRVTTRPSNMVRRGFKRRRTSRPSYRSKRRRTTRFRRRRFTRGGRVPRRRFGIRNMIKLFSRHTSSLDPEVSGSHNSISTQCPTWTILPRLAVSYSSIYDEWKPLKVISKFFVLQPALQLAAGSSKIQHWWVYDVDGGGRTFASVSDFANHPSCKWKFVTPFSSSTHRLRPTFRQFDSRGVITGVRKVDNPWRPLAEWTNGAGVVHQNYSAIQHLFTSRVIPNEPPFTIIRQDVYTFLLRGNRNGQQYAT